METEQMVTCNASRLPEFSTGQSVGAFVGVAGDGMDQPFEQGSGKATRAVPCPVTVGNGTWIFYYYFSLCLFYVKGAELISKGDFFWSTCSSSFCYPAVLVGARVAAGRLAWNRMPMSPGRQSVPVCLK